MHWIDPACLPETKGAVTQFLLDPHGDPDGFILEGERQVYCPPHLGARIAQRVAPGDIVIVRGIKPRAADIIAAISITSQDGETIVDDGPPRDDDEHERPEAEPHATEVAGTVVLSLFGPKGELRGALLDDGTSLRIPHHTAEQLRTYLTPGARVQAWGDLVETGYGRTLEVSEIAEQADIDTDVGTGA
ncbi:hypothetical protein B0G57_12373 [Trinickia symbiotica]|uniref:Uncharacterized protein n=1 Tax=Trinickia symbiotica TaxID=863227 RepID=A0A2N7WRT4_9BURK|nr:hypothetical protein [Trinickia symbiotica]PMS32173.1 hypothetical protein C0Z20_27180 [Trinickia symbiotica]PPK41978.1 hypothetical protein B0G57_12373 [Trinickia symbiotica]